MVAAWRWEGTNHVPGNEIRDIVISLNQKNTEKKGVT